MLSPAFAQTAPKTFTHPDTGIIFNTWSASDSQTKGGFTVGMALPSNALTTDATEFIGYLVCFDGKGRKTTQCPPVLTFTIRNAPPPRMVPTAVGAVFLSEAP